MALCVLLFCLAPLWYVTWKLEADIKGLETGYRCRKPSSRLWRAQCRREETRPSRSDQNPADAGHPAAHRHLAAGNGQPVRMQSSHFVPAAETVVEKNRIRLDAPFPASRQFPAPCPPAERTAVAFRHGIFERHPFRALPAYSLGFGHVHATANTPRTDEGLIR